MIKVNKKSLITVYACATVLILLYILSLTVFSSGNNSRKHIQQLQLLHEADISNINIITIQNTDGAVILTKSDNMWVVVNQNDIDDRIPADTQRLSKLFLLLVSKHNMIKAGKTENTTTDSYGFNDSDGTVISLYKNGELYQSLSFGKLNFAQTERYFTTQELKAIYLAGNEFEGFLSSSLQIWADPYIISEQLRESVFTMGDVQTIAFYDLENGYSSLLDTSIPEQKDSVQKLLELRHGGFAELTEKSQKLNIIIHFGDKSEVLLELFDCQESENEYIVHTTFNSERQGKAFTYKTQISQWTYSKIKEMML